MKHQFCVYYVALITTLIYAPSSYAGSCDCKPEVGNASAVVLQNCSKEWSQNQCTLREAGATSASPSEIRAFIDRFNFKPQEKFSDVLQHGPFDEAALETAVITQMYSKENVEFLADVLNVIHDNANSISNQWGQANITTFKGKYSQSSQSNRCFYSETYNKSTNFYLNFNTENVPCVAWRAFK